MEQIPLGLSLAIWPARYVRMAKADEQGGMDYCTIDVRVSRRRGVHLTLS
jgi:hypothetical protein